MNLPRLFLPLAFLPALHAADFHVAVSGEDSNPGTWPVQSERMFAALKGLGATVRYVELPAEDHGYRARESVGHTLREMSDWMKRQTRDPRAPAAK